MADVVAKMLRCLDNPFLWRTSRRLLNLMFGLYRRRFRLLQQWGVLDGAPTVLDIGCGIGHYAEISSGPYLGVDLNERYIEHAARRYAGTNRAFRCVDVTRLWEEKKTFNLVLMADFLHHIPDDAAIAILRAAARLSDRHIISFEPVRQQTNRVGQWIIDNDRGHFMRPLEALHDLFRRAGLPVGESVELYLGPIRTRAILCRAEAAVLPRVA